MREDKEEELMKMFPAGYVILYIQPNSEPAYHWNNPKEDEFIEDYLRMLDQVFFEEQEGIN
jgi:hypothetical protein